MKPMICRSLALHGILFYSLVTAEIYHDHSPSENVYPSSNLNDASSSDPSSSGSYLGAGRPIDGPKVISTDGVLWDGETSHFLPKGSQIDPNGAVYVPSSHFDSNVAPSSAQNSDEHLSLTQFDGQDPGKNDGYPIFAGDRSNDTVIEDDNYGGDGLEFHNVIRAKYEMPPLQWDPKLASSSRAKASTCVFNHGDSEPFGENLARGTNTINAAIQLWYDEKRPGLLSSQSFDVSFKFFNFWVQINWLFPSLRLVT